MKQWFRDAFERMARDGRETQWRALCESDQPELVPLPDPIDNSWTALRRLLVVRAVRDDRLLQLSKLFVAGVLGKRYVELLCKRCSELRVSRQEIF